MNDPTECPRASANAGPVRSHRNHVLELEHSHLFRRNPQAMWVSDRVSERILDVNDAAVTAYGFSRPEFLAMTTSDLFAVDPGHSQSDPLALQTDSNRPTSQRHRRRDGRTIEVEAVSREIEFEGRAAQLTLISDVTERRELEARLREAATIETIGSLAGGIAHDFGNILAAVIGYGDLLVTELGDDPRAADAREIVRAGRRAADLTRQLLAFARHQSVAPRPTDVNEVLTGIGPMLGRLIGEGIDLATKLAPDRAVIEIDPSRYS